MPPAARFDFPNRRIATDSFDNDNTQTTDILGIEVEAIDHEGDNSLSSFVTRIVLQPKDWQLKKEQQHANNNNTSQQVRSSPKSKRPKVVNSSDDSSSAEVVKCPRSILARKEDSKYRPSHDQQHEQSQPSSPHSVLSFDSIDEIKQDSNEEKMLKHLAQHAAEQEAHHRKILLLQKQQQQQLQQTPPATTPNFHDATESQYMDVLHYNFHENETSFLHFCDDDMDEGDYFASSQTEATLEEIMEHLLESTCCDYDYKTNSKPKEPVLKSSMRPVQRWSTGECLTCESKLPCEEEYHTVLDSEILGDGKTVRFNQVEINEFQMTLGHHPSATSGPPIMIDWDSSPKVLTTKVEDYERARLPRRSRGQLRLSLQQRHHILVKEKGFTFEQVTEAWKEALDVRKQRKETLERGLALVKWDEVWESTCRKFNRLVDALDAL